MRQALLGVAFCALALPITALDAQDEVSDPLQTQVLDRFEPLVGKWYFDFDSIPKESRDAQRKDGLEESWIAIDWGTDRQWMTFTDSRQTNGVVRLVGQGLIAFSPMSQEVIFTEHGARGATVTGNLEAKHEGLFIRDIAVARTDRTWRQIDQWQLSTDGSCMTWSSSYFRQGEQRNSSPFRYCKRTSQQD